MKLLKLSILDICGFFSEVVGIKIHSTVVKLGEKIKWFYNQMMKHFCNLQLTTINIWILKAFLVQNYKFPNNHRHLKIIDCLTGRVFFISTVNGHSKKRRKEAYYELCY